MGLPDRYFGLPSMSLIHLFMFHIASIEKIGRLHLSLALFLRFSHRPRALIAGAVAVTLLSSAPALACYHAMRMNSSRL